MKVLITGADGQLGRELLDTAPVDVEVRALGRKELDVTDADRVTGAVATFAPDAVVNCAAFTAVDRAEVEAERAFAVNAEGPGHLARTAADLGARLVHVSTDFVFDGASRRGYRPTDPTGPINAYGAGKLEGERRALAAGGDVVVVRTSWLYSRFGSNFVKTMLRLLAERDEVRVVADQVGSPTWARGLAEALWCAAGSHDLSGTHHWADLGSTSWYDFAVAIRDAALSNGLLHRTTPIRAVTTQDFPTRARRPALSVLDADEAWMGHDLAIRPWREALALMLDELATHGDA